MTAVAKNDETAQIARYINLVQRMTLRDRENTSGKGVDRFFSMDYMGAAEFEWGALPGSLKRMRESVRPSIRRIKHAQNIVWYVGPDTWFEPAEMFFQDQLKTRQNRKIRCQEPSRIYETFIGDDWAPVNQMYGSPPKKATFSGWWDLGNDWAFFTKKDTAQTWIKAVWGV